MLSQKMPLLRNLIVLSIDIAAILILFGLIFQSSAQSSLIAYQGYIMANGQPYLTEEVKKSLAEQIVMGKAMIGIGVIQLAVSFVGAVFVYLKAKIEDLEYLADQKAFEHMHVKWLDEANFIQVHLRIYANDVHQISPSSKIQCFFQETVAFQSIYAKKTGEQNRQYDPADILQLVDPAFSLATQIRQDRDSFRSRYEEEFGQMLIIKNKRPDIKTYYVKLENILEESNYRLFEQGIIDIFAKNSQKLNLEGKNPVDDSQTTLLRKTLNIEPSNQWLIPFDKKPKKLHPALLKNEVLPTPKEKAKLIIEKEEKKKCGELKTGKINEIKRWIAIKRMKEEIEAKEEEDEEEEEQKTVKLPSLFKLIPKLRNGLVFAFDIAFILIFIGLMIASVAKSALVIYAGYRLSNGQLYLSPQRINFFNDQIIAGNTLAVLGFITIIFAIVFSFILWIKARFEDIRYDTQQKSWNHFIIVWDTPAWFSIHIKAEDTEIMHVNSEQDLVDFFKENVSTKEFETAIMAENKEKTFLNTILKLYTIQLTFQKYFQIYSQFDYCNKSEIVEVTQFRSVLRSQYADLVKSYFLAGYTTFKTTFKEYLYFIKLKLLNPTLPSSILLDYLSFLADEAKKQQEQLKMEEKS